MNVASVAAASANTAAQTQNAVGLSVLKKAIDIQAAGALALVQAVPAAPAPGAAGSVVNTWA
ncbi:MAG: putative motility protein [Azoarcus sp.]|jgi:redox-regulated HSP33 family molecular chaperone|nr:putative motility protein [Azoarcus sp.]